MKPGLEHTIFPRLKGLTLERIRELRAAVLGHHGNFLGLSIPEAIIRVLHRRVVSMQLTTATSRGGMKGIKWQREGHSDTAAG